MNEEEIIKQYEIKNKTLKAQITKKDNKIKESQQYIVQITGEQYIRLVNIINYEKNKEWEDKIEAKIEELKKNKDFDEDVYAEEFAVDILKELLYKEK